MKKRAVRTGWLSLLLSSAVMISTLWSGALADGKRADWRHEIPSAMTEAAEAGKPVIVDVWAVWCAPCKLMEEKTWNLPTVIEAMNSFVALKVDSDANEVFTQRYDANSLPATLFLDGEGRLITQFAGFTDAGILLQAMDAVLVGYDAYLAAQAHRDDPAVMEQLADYYRSAGNPLMAVDFMKKSIQKDRQAAPMYLNLVNSSWPRR
jgi:thiol-disulfide isomerase/thioredoxin